MKNKNIKLILAGLAVLLVTVGTTYAWWKASQSVTQKVTMGNLNISATFDELEDPINYEPGLDVEQDGNIENTGSIAAIVKVENTSQIKFSGESNFQEADKTAVQFSLKPNGGEGYWYNDNSGNVYVLLDPAEKANVSGYTYFNGENMGNEYMNAEVKVSGKLKATQVIDGAIKTEFGIDASELREYSDPSSQVLNARKATTANSEAMNKLHELLNRGK